MKGHTNNPNGRPKGAKSKRSERVKALMAALIKDNFPKLKEEIDKLDGKDYVWAMDKIMSYSIPKPAADVNVNADVKATASVQHKKDMETLDNLPADVIADIADRLQTAMSAAAESTTEP